ncbi:restriction endonuclease subunit S [Lactobacillus ultunensis]|uniref:Type I restriction modification DNA specificity domain protein n=1 Tax=Lactobacillus ultunensis DSM 16047 TaxID=525365 RepID=C2EN49_9LACO|nr:restriction endonuclease subunit S [Lactobacillus ultunensis]EEJ72045.1 type I restriction modification DNA specificity domain protein [Lactobacillus ultunensis DSM 16047]KRL82122.1 hypothetical protein FC57_GL002067 [Lactobacillus ultunensis DSM 16047]
MTNNTNRQAPVLRFKGFSDDWEQRKLNDIGNFYYGKSAPKWSVTNNGGIPCIRYGELYTKYSTKIDKILSFTSIDKDKLKFSSGHEVLIPRVGEEPLDFAKHASWLSVPNVAIGEMITVFNTKEDPLFIANYLRAKYIVKFAKFVEGGNVSNLYFDRYKYTNIFIPTKKEERSVSKLIYKINKLISLQQRKMKELNSLKQSISKLILENQSDKIRFCKFKESNWKTYQFGQLYQKTNDKNKNVNDNFKIISVAGMDWGQSVTKSSKEYMKPYNITKLGDIVFEGHKNKQHEFGRFIENTLGTGLVSHIFDVYRPKNEISDLNFWKFYINSENIMNRVLRMSTSSARMMNNLNNKDLKKQKIVIPGYEEMKKIGNLLLTLQENIGNSQTKLMLLRNIEKALLQDLFI